jgi:hypothetical protein
MLKKKFESDNVKALNLLRFGLIALLVYWLFDKLPTILRYFF